MRFKLEQTMQHCSSFYNLKPQIEQILLKEENTGFSIGKDQISFDFVGARSRGGYPVYNPKRYNIIFKADEVFINYSVSGENYRKNYEFSHEYVLKIKGNHLELEDSNVHTVWKEDGITKITDEPVSEFMQNSILDDVIKMIKPLEKMARQSIIPNSALFFSDLSTKLSSLDIQSKIEQKSFSKS